MGDFMCSTKKYFLVYASSLIACLGVDKAMSVDCIPPPSNQVAWWRAQNNAIETISGNDGKLINGTGFGIGKVGKAFKFDGASNYVSVLDNSIWTLGKYDFTIDLWVNFSQVNYRSPFVAHDDGIGGQNKWIFWYDESGHTTPGGPALRFHINSSGPFGPLDTVYYPWIPSVGKWYHVAATREGSTYALYVNGLQVATSTEQNYDIQDSVAPLTIGEAEGYMFNGRLDEVDIFNRALSADEVNAIYLAGSAGKCVPPAPPLSGTLKGMIPSTGKVVCKNITTIQSVTIPITKGLRTWNCPDAGLVVNAGDKVQVTTNITGFAE